MRGTITLGVEVGSVQKLTAVREMVAAVIDDAHDVELRKANSACDDEMFTVIGSVRGKPDQSWSQTIWAQSKDEAAEKAIAEDKQRTVVVVLAGEIAV